MRFPRYWAKGGVDLPDASGQDCRFESWGWSDESPQDAERVGRERAGKVAQSVLQGQPPDHYLYSDRPVREEILEEIRDADGAVSTVITRNSYGCRVLNCSHVMFVDIDEPETRDSGSILQALAGLFGKSKASPAGDWQAEAVARAEELCRADARIRARVYRTRAGLRILMSHGPADPASAATHDVMASLGSDPLYVRLCRAQESFRARLTPKPWRCGVLSPTIRFPWPDPEAKAAFREWEESYRAAAEPYATCRYLQTLGNDQIHPVVSPVVELHDRLTKSASSAQLA